MPVVQPYGDDLHRRAAITGNRALPAPFEVDQFRCRTDADRQKRRADAAGYVHGRPTVAISAGDIPAGARGHMRGDPKGRDLTAMGMAAQNQ